MSEVKLDVLAKSLEESNARAADMQMESRMFMQSMMAMMSGAAVQRQVPSEVGLQSSPAATETGGDPALVIAEYSDAEWEAERLSLPAAVDDQEGTAGEGTGEGVDQGAGLRKSAGKRGAKVVKKGAKVVGKLVELRLRSADSTTEGRGMEHSPGSAETFDMDDPRLPGQQLGSNK